ncbi:UDP-glycosyltransferase UGT5-like [Danaus plexippus]|uniref:UDP-glycosyltransferase UGT5-like n=1 Tax=Danaus plexippus TaxID=13037 RepID=UPI002AB076D9|nr:UDP-glycosyltransferase UGT5-like [Danaus plexippus]
MLRFQMILYVVCLSYVDSANILYVMPFSSISHYIMLKPIGLELARKGHNVTVITPIRDNNPPSNYHQVLVDDKKIWDILGMERPNIFTMVDMSAEEFHDKILWSGGVAFTELALNSTEVRKFLKADNTFDLVLCEQFFQEAMYALAYKYNAPLALVTTFGSCMRHNIATGNPLQIPNILAEFLDIKNPTSFLGRMRNIYFTLYEFIWWRYWYLEKHENLVKKYLPELSGKVPKLYEIQKNVSLMLINSHYSAEIPAAFLPNIVEIGGVHLTRSNTSLPKDLQKILDDSKYGVVYMSLGSNVKSAELPDSKREAFLKVFASLNQTVLWKWEDDNLENKPENLITRQWLPQKEILAHPNVKVFISHGGLIGTQEAIFNGVPLVGVPIYADQYNNLLYAEKAGFGKILQYHEINENHLFQTLSEVLTNDSYMQKAKEVSRRFKDRPMTPLDTAVFWLEYVIRNNGAEFMKNPTRNLNWFSFYMLDVYALFLLIVFLFIMIFYKIVMFIAQMYVDYKVKVTIVKKEQ